MANLDILAEKLFALLKGHGFKIKLFDTDGNEVTDPSAARRYFIVRPNIMVTIDEDEAKIDFSKGANVSGNDIDKLQHHIRRLANEFQMNSSIKVFGKAIQPRDYSYQAKTQKDTMMNEMAEIKPVNSMLLGQVLYKLGRFGKATIATLADDIGVEPNDVQRVMNKLVKDGKAVAAGVDQHGYHVYTKAMEEALSESTQNVSVHDLRGLSSSEAYDQTQTSDDINSGDVLIVDGGVAVMVDAWPVMVSGEFTGFHEIAPGYDISTLDNGKYAESGQVAKDVAAGASSTASQLNELSDELLNRYESSARADMSDAIDANDYGTFSKRHKGAESANQKLESSADKRKRELAQTMKHSAVTGQDNRDLSAQNSRQGKPTPKVGKFAYPSKSASPVQKKSITPFQVNEVSTDTLAKYKTAAAADARAADKKGDYKKADKRFGGIVKATKKQFANDAKSADTLAESFSRMFGSMKTSQQTLENVRIIVKHKAPVAEDVRGSRSRNISAIFLECNGERFRFPNTYLPGARAMAQHMAHGGVIGDKVGAYITESVDQLIKLQSFNRYVTTNNLINEDSSGIVETVKENIQTIRTELKKISGTKTYETVKARLETFERSQLDENDTAQLKELFTVRRFDEKFEEVLPIVKQLVQEKDTYYKRIEEAASNVITLRDDRITSTPIFEFASENAKLGFRISELSARIVENDELAGFVGKIGTKLCKEGSLNSFEKAVMMQVLENVIIGKPAAPTTVFESFDIDAYFDRFTLGMFR